MSDSKDSTGAKCSRCMQPIQGMASLTLVASPGQGATRICGRCAADDHAKSLTSIEEADDFIEDTMQSIASLEKIIAKLPEMPAVPEGLEGAMTPLTVYRTMQLHLAAFKSRRMEMLTEADSEVRLAYEIKKAIEAEDYELAQQLKRRQEQRGSADEASS